MPAMIVGCLSPDFLYFLHLSPHGHYGHTWAGVFILDLPLSVLGLWLFYRYVKYALPSAAPGLFPFGKESLSTRPALKEPKGLLIVLLSILFGAVTHIVWDSFTHPTFWPYAHFSFLHAPVWEPFLGSTEMCRLLQHISSLLGMAILIALWIKWVRAESPRDTPLVAGAGFILILAAMLATLLRVGVSLRHTPHKHGDALVAETVVTFMSALWVELVLLGALRRPADASEA